MARLYSAASIAVCGVAVLLGCLAAAPAGARPPFERAGIDGQSGTSGLDVPQAAGGSDWGSRIVGGDFTTNNKYPWQALVIVDGDAHPGTSFGLCGGSLIHPLIVMTA